MVNGVTGIPLASLTIYGHVHICPLCGVLMFPNFNAPLYMNKEHCGDMKCPQFTGLQKIIFQGMQ